MPLHRRPLLFGTAAFAGASGLAPAQAQKPEVAPAPQGQLRLRRFEVMDPSGFDRPVPAASLLAPADWRLEGGVSWGSPSCSTDLVNMHARLSSPDGRLALEWLPELSWTWMDDPAMVPSLRQAHAAGQGCAVAPPLPAAEVVQQYALPRLRPGARVLDLQRDATASQAAREQIGRLAGPQATLRAEVVRLRIAHGGVEEWLVATVATMSGPILSLSAMARGETAYTRNHVTIMQSAYVFRAPQGGLEAAEPLLGVMVATFRKNPAWGAAVDQVRLNINWTRIQAEGERARIRRDTMAQIGETQLRAWQSRQAAQDRAHIAFVQVIRGVEPMLDPRLGAQVEVPIGYLDVWSNGQGEFILSNDPNFDPRRAERGTWNTLERARR